jgi:hypothetical protein
MESDPQVPIIGAELSYDRRHCSWMLIQQIEQSMASAAVDHLDSREICTATADQA